MKKYKLLFIAFLLFNLSSSILAQTPLSNGETNVSVNYGFGSYNFNTNDFGYLGEKYNTFRQNFGYGLGALANISDLVTRADNIKAIDRKNNPMSGKTEQELQQIFDETSNTRLNRFLNKKSDAANFAGNSASNISPKEFLSIDRIDLLPLDGKENGLFGGFQHDLAYYNAGTDGARGVFFNTNVTSADFRLIQGMTKIIRGGGFTRDVIFRAQIIRTSFILTSGVKSIYPFSYNHNPYGN